jgi:hypothetical protein
VPAALVLPQAGERPQAVQLALAQVPEQLREQSDAAARREQLPRAVQPVEPAALRA